MKKYAGYILIVITVIGSLGLVARVQAAAGCYGTNGQSVAFDQSTCLGLASQGYTWKSSTSPTSLPASSTATPVSTPTPVSNVLTSPVQTYCDYGSGDIEKSDSDTECTTNHGTPTSAPVSSTGTTAGSTSSTTSTSDLSGLVHCDGSTAHPCDFNALIDLINTIIHFLLFDLALPITAIMFVYAGFELVTSGGSTEKRGIAKKVFTNAALGFIIAIAGWLIIKTVLVILGYNGSWIGF